MSNDNPFAQLKKLALPEKNPDLKKKPGGAGPARSLPASGKKHGSASEQPDDGNESALFLQAVANARPQPKEKHTGRKAKGKAPKLPSGVPATALSGTAPTSSATALVITEDPNGEFSLFAESMRSAGIKKEKNQTDAAAPPEQAGALSADAMAHNTSATQASCGSPQNSTDLFAQNVPELDAEENVFAQAMNGVHPIQKRGREIEKPKPQKPAHPAGKSPAQVMQEILDGRIEFALQHTGEYVEGHITGVDPQVLDQLRIRQFSPEAHIDLHGMTAALAHESLIDFIKNAYQRNMRTVTVVTGRGNNSPDGVGVLRNLMQTWLTRDPLKRVVLAFCTAKNCDGGAGALYVLLRKYKKGRGKIYWDMPKPGTGEDF